MLGIDLSKIPLDKELTADDSTEANKVRSHLESLLSNEEAKWTPRKIAERVGIGGLGPLCVGTPSAIADELERWVRDGDIDGFNLAHATTPGTFEDVVDLLVPELRRRSIYPEAEPDDAKPWTARERLLGRGQRTLPSDHLGSTYKYGVYQEGDVYKEDKGAVGA